MSQRITHPGRITFLLPNKIGAGTQRAQILLAEGIVKSGYAVDLVCCTADGSLPPPSRESGVRFIEFKSRTILTALIPLLRYLRQENPVAVFAALNPVNLLSLVAARVSGVDTRLVMAVQNHFGAKWEHQFTATFPLRKILFKFMYRRAHHVVAVSEDIRHFLVDELGLKDNQTTAIPNPVDTTEIMMLAGDPCPHTWLEAGHKIPVLIGVGRLDQQKDFPTLIDAFALVLKEMPARLLILGTGPHQARLQKLISRQQLDSHLQLVGFQSNPYAWMARADLFVLSSRWEGYPLVLLEAMSLGLPIVSTDCRSGPGEMVALSEDFSLAPVGNPRSLAKKILERLRSDTLRTPVALPGSFDKVDCAMAYLAAAGLPKIEK